MEAPLKNNKYLHIKAKLIFLLNTIFLLSCNGNQPDKTGNGLIVETIDIDASGTYIVSGTYSSSSTGGRILDDIIAEQNISDDTLRVNLFPLYISIGKDPVKKRVFAFQDQIKEINRYEIVIIKMADKEKRILPPNHRRRWRDDFP